MHQNLIKKQHGFSIHGKHRNFQEDNGKIEWRSRPSYMNLWSFITGLLGVFFLAHLTLSFFFSVSPMVFWNFCTNFDMICKIWLVNTKPRDMMIWELCGIESHRFRFFLSFFLKEIESEWASYGLSWTGLMVFLT